jgi:hypothetical protein
LALTDFQQCRAKKMKNLIIVPLLAISVLLSVGCNKKKLPGPPTHPVHGKVFYQGRPAVDFCVALYPIQPWPGPQFAPSGMTDSNGEFKIHSYQPGDGAPAGEYTATFVWPQKLTPEQEADGVMAVDQLQKRYADPKKSTFRVTIQEGDNELPPFQLK